MPFNPRSTEIQIELKHGTLREAATRDRLVTLLDRYDISRRIRTRNILIDEQSSLHSHPVLTLHARHAGEDGRLLSTFLHEQLHWHLRDHRGETSSAVQEIKQLLPDLPMGGREGAQDFDSSYLHVVVSYLEWAAVENVLGAEEAAEIITFWSQNHYTAIYQAVIRERVCIGEIVERYQLAP